MIFRRRGGRAEEDAEQDAQTSPAGRAAELRKELAAIVTGANADGGRLPPGAVPTVRDIDDVLRPLLVYVEARSASDEELRYLTMIVRDYLPRALDDFLALPSQYTDRPGITGTTPAEDLVRQLQLLDEGAIELQDSVYSGDAAKLAIQARFLEAKFRRSDLDS
ncbi:hypothetical protein Ga0074812_1029 [Parafrankia irregularis]|uniref:Uncharacterized protein n=1 Tax=Parafrankia irregularis TaxID=795642 RepID=A0A0S4QH86_9ACTN|nr:MULTISPECIES: hypothetical protein [Parafrankia]EFC83612.1 conserved hypothetical protein [Parafrankia sp. EUN1f]MBE3203346.1 hypothetical protein [Parafrankia sp. CH37]CUU54006.1 hypothetical protein Ga0074812_1029 [Parafrankia irregularis]